MRSSPLTIGMLPGWPVYGSISQDRFLLYIINGARAAALDHGCNLLVACGVSRSPGMRSLHTAWPVVSSDCDYVPVGHWNTQGLLVAAPLRSEERSQYIRKVIGDGFPVVFIGSGEGNPSILVDNPDGIHQAVEHLIRHGHRRIAFIAGDPLDPGDSAQRLQAYQKAIEEFEAVSDPRLIAYGYHYREGGRKAMDQIITTGIPFTAVVASNDVSAFGAMELLKSAGRRIPTDVAVIGFDDLPSAMGQVPPLTTVHYPFFDAGAMALESLLDRIANPTQTAKKEIRIPARLAIRESCGCSSSYQVDRQEVRARLSREKMDADRVGSIIEENLRSGLAGKSQLDFSAITRDFVAAFLRGVKSHDPKEFPRVLEESLTLTEPSEDHSELWQSIISILRLGTAAMIPADESTYAENLLHQARLAITDYAERRSLRKRLSVSEVNRQLNWMNARMLSAGSKKEILQIFTEHLTRIGVRFAQVALFETRHGDPLGGISFYCNLWQSAGDPEAEDIREACIDIKDFPNSEIIPDRQPYAIAVLPIVFQEDPLGFAIFDAASLEPMATVVRQLSAVLKTQQLIDQVDELSLADPSTGVQNRRFFELFLEREMKQCRRYRRGLTLLLLNLEGWEEYAAAQDAQKNRDLFRVLARRIIGCIRRGSDAVCRYTGDTFAILLPETDQPGAQAVADSLRRNIGQPEGLQDSIDIRIGIAIAEPDRSGEDSENLMAAANRALFLAKTSGRNQTAVVHLGSPDTSNPISLPNERE